MTPKIRVKVCGVRNLEDAMAAVDAGADLIGLNFVSRSPRCLSLDEAEAISKELAGRVERVALFCDPRWDEVDRILRRVDFDRVQLHGSESPEDVERFELPVIKAIRGADLAAAEEYPGTILLLDHPEGGGGKGKAWDWSAASELLAAGQDVILAGGLKPENIASVLESLDGYLPWGVDVASGVEDKDGSKNPEKMRKFIEVIRSAEQSHELEEFA